MECWPSRSPLSFSKWLFGGTRRSSSLAAWLTWSSFLLATLTRSGGHAFLAFLVSRPSKTSSVPSSLNETIIDHSITHNVNHVSYHHELDVPRFDEGHVSERGRWGSFTLRHPLSANTCRSCTVSRPRASRRIALARSLRRGADYAALGSAAPAPCMIRTARGSQRLGEGGRGWRRSMARA